MKTIYKLITAGACLFILAGLVYMGAKPASISAVNNVPAPAMFTINVTYFGNFTPSGSNHTPDMSNKIFVGASPAPFGTGSVTIPLFANGLPIIDSDSSDDVPGLHIMRRNGYIQIGAHGDNGDNALEAVKASFSFSNVLISDIKNGPDHLYENSTNGKCGINEGNLKDSNHSQDEYTFSGGSGTLCSMSGPDSDVMRIFYNVAAMVVPAPIACSSNVNCGINGSVGGNYCQGSNSIYQSYKTYTCNNPGTSVSFCTSSTTPQFQNNCAANQICSNGSCNGQTPPAQPIACTTNAQCGANNLTGNPFCQGNNVFTNQLTYYCNNPGTPQSFCSNLFDPQLTKSCGTNKACTNGDCASRSIVCGSDADCGANGLTGNSFCQYGNVFRNQITHSCNNPGTSQSFCSNSLTPQPTLTCSPNQNCVNGSCATTQAVACSTNAQCGTSGLTGGLFCQGNSVYQNYTSRTCDNPGTASSTCTGSTAPQLQNNCAANQTCSNGSCTNTQSSLIAYCSASPSSINTNQSSTFTANATGGTGSYIYSWSGACTGTGSTCSNTFSTAGTQMAAITVTSGSQSASATCPVAVNQPNSNVSVTCSANPSSINTNQSSTFTANATGGTGSYIYSWSGACTGTGSTCSNTFSTAGTQAAAITVTSGSNSASSTCSVGVNQACTQNYQQRCIGTSNYWYDSCGSQGSYIGSCGNINTCTPNYQQRCVGTTNYWYDSCGNQGGYIGSCGNTCTPNFQQRCAGNSNYWYDSCGNQGSYIGTCGLITNNTTLTVSKTARNLTSGSGFLSSTYATPSDMLMFMITLQAPSQDVQNVSIRDTLPAGLIYNNQLVVACTSGGNGNNGNNNCNNNNYNYSGNITSGINLNTIYAGQTVTVTYQAQVASAANFSFGTTTLNNGVSASGSNVGTQTAQASVVVTRAGVLGASTVSTGLTNNFWVDSFFLPLLLTIIGLWMWKAGMFFGIARWLNNKKKMHRSYNSKKELSTRIAMLQKLER